MSLLGAAIAVIGTFGGFAVARRFLANNDEALLAGITWGTLAGLALGGLAVGGMLATVGEGQGVALLLSPGVFVGLPAAISGIVNQEVLAVASALAWILAASWGGAVLGHCAASRTLHPKEP
jgi:hypothetical protein